MKERLKQRLGVLPITSGDDNPPLNHQVPLEDSSDLGKISINGKLLTEDERTYKPTGKRHKVSFLLLMCRYHIIFSINGKKNQFFVAKKKMKAVNLNLRYFLE